MGCQLKITPPRCFRKMNFTVFLRADDKSGILIDNENDVFIKKASDKGGFFVFSIGDKVLYPMHGAGVIERIEDREVLGETVRFYVMTLPFGEMLVSIPVDRNREVGLRPVIGERQARQLLEEFGAMPPEEDGNWNKRYRDNMLRIKSGDIAEVSSVLFLLMKREHDKGLSTGERKMMVSARQIFVSEISLAIDRPRDEIERRLADVFA